MNTCGNNTVWDFKNTEEGIGFPETNSGWLFVPTFQRLTLAGYSSPLYKIVSEKYSLTSSLHLLLTILTKTI